MNLCPNWKSWIYPLSQISSVRQPTLNYAPLLWKVYWGCLLEEGLIYLRSTLQHLWEMLSFGLVLSILVCISERKAVYLMSLSFVMVTFKTFWSHKKKKLPSMTHVFCRWCHRTRISFQNWTALSPFEGEAGFCQSIYQAPDHTHAVLLTAPWSMWHSRWRWKDRASIPMYTMNMEILICSKECVSLLDSLKYAKMFLNSELYTLCHEYFIPYLQIF